MDFGPFGVSEVLFIAALALLVFGPRRLPEIGASAGRSMAKLRRGLADLRRAYEAELDEDTRRTLQETAREVREAGRSLDVAGREAWRDLGSVYREDPLVLPRSSGPSGPSSPTLPGEASDREDPLVLPRSSGPSGPSSPTLPGESAMKGEGEPSRDGRRP